MIGSTAAQLASCHGTSVCRGIPVAEHCSIIQLYRNRIYQLEISLPLPV